MTDELPLHLAREPDGFWRGTCSHHGVVTMVFRSTHDLRCPGGPEGLGCATSVVVP